MTHYFDDLTQEQIGTLLDALDREAFKSRRDGCSVVLVKCSKCDRSFEEELEAAKGVVGSRLDFLCLGCDPASRKYAFTGLTVQLGWFW